MPHFLIESPHTDQECLKTLEQVLAAGYLTHFYWGCKGGEHTGWVIFEAPSKAEAIMVVPSFIRHKARAVELVQFDPEMVRAAHGAK